MIGDNHWNIVGEVVFKNLFLLVSFMYPNLW